MQYCWEAPDHSTTSSTICCSFITHFTCVASSTIGWHCPTFLDVTGYALTPMTESCWYKYHSVWWSEPWMVQASWRWLFEHCHLMTGDFTNNKQNHPTLEEGFFREIFPGLAFPIHLPHASSSFQGVPFVSAFITMLSPWEAFPLWPGKQGHFWLSPNIP